MCNLLRILACIRPKWVGVMLVAVTYLGDAGCSIQVSEMSFVGLLILSTGRSHFMR
jgi:hypothetical protein